MKGDLRSQILIDVQAQGMGTLDATRQGLEQVKAQLAALTAAFAAGEASATEYQRGLNQLGSAYKFLNEQLKILDPEWERLQATLRGMATRSDEAAQSFGNLTRAQQQGVAAVTELVQANEHQRRVLEALDPEWERLQATLQAMGQRDARAAAAGIEATNAALQEGLAAIYGITPAARAKAQADAEMAAELRRAGVEQERLNAFLEQAAVHERSASAATRVHIGDLREYVAQIMATARATGDASETTASFTARAPALGRGAAMASYGFLSLAHAVQDAQYGFSAVVNNIPLIVQGFGGSAGLAGAAMLAGVALQVATPHLAAFATELGIGTDKSKYFGDSLDGMQAKLKALTDKPWKTTLDYQMIADAEKKIEDLKLALQHYEGANGESQKTDFQTMLKNTVEVGGGREAILKGVTETELAKFGSRAMPEDINWSKANRKLEAHWDKVYRDTEGKEPAIVREGYHQLANWHGSQAAGAEQRMNEADASHSKALLGKFLAGDPEAIKRIRRRVAEHPGAFPAGFRNSMLGGVDMPGGGRLEFVPDTNEKFLEQEGLSESLDDELKAKNAKAKAARLKHGHEATKAEHERTAAADRAADILASRAPKELKNKIIRQIMEGMAGGKTNAQIFEQVQGELASGFHNLGAEQFAQPAASKLFAQMQASAMGHLAAQGGDPAAAAQAYIAEQDAVANAKAQKKSDAAHRKQEAAARKADNAQRRVDRMGERQEDVESKRDIQDFVSQNEVLHAQQAVANARTASQWRAAVQRLQNLMMRLQAEQMRRNVDDFRFQANMQDAQRSLLPPLPLH